MPSRVVFASALAWPPQIWPRGSWTRSAVCRFQLVIDKRINRLSASQPINTFRGGCVFVLDGPNPFEAIKPSWGLASVVVVIVVEFSILVHFSLTEAIRV